MLFLSISFYFACFCVSPFSGRFLSCGENDQCPFQTYKILKSQDSEDEKLILSKSVSITPKMEGNRPSDGLIPTARSMS